MSEIKIGNQTYQLRLDIGALRRVLKDTQTDLLLLGLQVPTTQLLSLKLCDIVASIIRPQLPEQWKNAPLDELVAHLFDGVESYEQIYQLAQTFAAEIERFFGPRFSHLAQLLQQILNAIAHSSSTQE